MSLTCHYYHWFFRVLLKFIWLLLYTSFWLYSWLYPLNRQQSPSVGRHIRQCFPYNYSSLIPSDAQSKILRVILETLHFLPAKSFGLNYHCYWSILVFILQLYLFHFISLFNGSLSLLFIVRFDQQVYLNNSWYILFEKIVLGHNLRMRCIFQVTEVYFSKLLPEKNMFLLNLLICETS